MLKLAKISARIPEPLKVALEARAEADQETLGEVIRIALTAFLWPRKKPQRSED